MTLIYVVQAQIGLIKIGCARIPEQRLATIRTHSPVLTRLIAQWPGRIADERELHARFLPYRQHSEWFQVDGPVAVFVDWIMGRGLKRVQEWEECTFAGNGGRVNRAAALRSIALKKVWADPEWRLKQIITMRQARADRKHFPGFKYENATQEERLARNALLDRIKAEVVAERSAAL
jgi:hypothetical protein